MKLILSIELFMSNLNFTLSSSKERIKVDFLD